MGCCWGKKRVGHGLMPPRASQNIKSIAEVEQTAHRKSRSIDDEAKDRRRKNYHNGSEVLYIDAAGDAGGHGILGAALVYNGSGMADTGGKVMEIAAAPLDVGNDVTGTGDQMLGGAAAGGELIAETVTKIGEGISDLFGTAASNI